MSRYGWHNCPKDIHRQVKGFVDAVRDILGDNLAGVYLHGSLAMGCFNAERSDIDLLVVTQRGGMMIEEKRRVAELLLRHSAAPRPIEISFLSEQDLHPWQYPTPFDFHYGEDWREHYEKDLSTDRWRKWNQDQHKDSDLAAHIVVILNRGVCLCGKPIEEVFPPVPKEHYIDSICSDLRWGKDRMAQNPVYYILNACRVYAYLREGRICSKDEGGVWASRAFPKEFQGLVTQALEIYRGNCKDEHLDALALEKFVAYVDEQVKTLSATKLA